MSRMQFKPNSNQTVSTPRPCSPLYKGVHVIAAQSHEPTKQAKDAIQNFFTSSRQMTLSRHPYPIVLVNKKTKT
ncbi:predicted protein [Plenodomus lingam JN3]|uniref:Predicted protein n=1 Tax=Leptosphaeria maculans (strain JN3 / isolate v23.1.3 / race Av1-4-5-6-7-8) TaxID=985895 RepID=E5A541_LEPMJ|nr:predicted protein [Plenodomus lingam JN3]CBX98739.1 predicted protein [Plenodomus lingam JN3]